MKLQVLGSSSSGNCYLLRASTGETLIIEAGVSLLEMQRTIDFNVNTIVGCLISHSHQDHAKFAKQYIKAAVDVYSSMEMLETLGNPKHRCLPLIEGKIYEIGGFKVKAFEAKHDVYCLGFLIQHSESGLILFLTDSYYSPYKFKGLNQVIIEANYSNAILAQNVTIGEVNSFVKDRVIQSHFSLENCLELLKVNDLAAVNNIVLIHLSDRNSDAAFFKKSVEDLTGKSVHIADRGLQIDFNKQPF